MRIALNAMDIEGTVVIGEGERDEAPMLYIGEKVGTGNGPKIDIALVYKGKILETCTSNILFFKDNEYFSPKNDCYIGNTIKYLKGKIKISFKDIYYKDLKKFEIILKSKKRTLCAPPAPPEGLFLARVIY